ncbi:hypothetical protein DAQ1742_04288 [Dickeya aquatica]|uniref:Uncharacterized protein n=1 Tax=Dickeya aquatica TaxID=1401087 RepID=A0A375AG18_9GAMM|nr:hypothetical protein DAQ1742_04288 [Dickeya aquatica]
MSEEGMWRIRFFLLILKTGTAMSYLEFYSCSMSKHQHLSA